MFINMMTKIAKNSRHFLLLKQKIQIQPRKKGSDFKKAAYKQVAGVNASEFV